MIKIFIVEDDSLIAEKIKQHLENLGYEGAIVQDFRKVLPEFIAFDPQLVLMMFRFPFSVNIIGAGKYGKC